MKPPVPSDAGTGDGPRSGGALNAAALAGVSVAEWALFCRCTHRHFGWTYPRWFDQLQYLREAYGSYDVMRANGFFAGARHALGLVSPQGSLHGFLALLAFCVGGPTRDAALSVNLFAFLALQAALFAAVRRTSGSWSLAWAAIGLLLAVRSPWSGGPGSAVDFRLDWMAACAYGVALCAAVAGGGFRSSRWAVLFGGAVGATLLTRHLTAVYFALIYALLVAWFLLWPGRRRRCANLFLSGLCALVVSCWAFMRSWGVIYTYYWVGHFSGPERGLRETRLGLLSDLRWLGSELLLRQFGLPAAVIGAAAGAVFLAFGLAGRETRGPGRREATGAWPAVLAFLAAPALVLMEQPEKATQPLNIMIPALVWVVVLGWVHLARRSSRFAAPAVGACVALGGAVLFARAELAQPYGVPMVAEYRDVNALSDYLYFRSEEAGLSSPRVAATWLVDALGADVFDVLGRERHGRPLPFAATLPTGLFTADPALVYQRLAESDFVCLVTRAPVNFPFDRQMAAMLPAVRLWCDSHLRRDADLQCPGFSASVYERPLMARPPGGVDLSAMLAADGSGPAYAPPRPPGPPLFAAAEPVLWTTKAEFHYGVRAAYDPITYAAAALPDGVAMDPGSGEIRGRFKRAGSYLATVTARNAMGSTSAGLALEVADETWGARVTAPEASAAGAQVELRYSAFDSAGKLDFIDVSDLTTGKTLGRLVAGQGEKAVWQGAYLTRFAEAGAHEVVMRFVRLDAAGAYVFLDRTARVAVSR